MESALVAKTIAPAAGGGGEVWQLGQLHGRESSSHAPVLWLAGVAGLEVLVEFHDGVVALGGGDLDVFCLELAGA